MTRGVQAAFSWTICGVLAVTVVVLATGLGAAADWGNIAPGRTTAEMIQAQYGSPTKKSQAKEDGYDTMQWVYEGPQAPSGMVRMVIDFGLLTPAGYQPQVVRTFRLEPKPGAFGPTAVILGWGQPDREGTLDGFPVMVYASGLVVYLDQEGKMAVSMVFTLPQPLAPPRNP
jgi:hypothetical protein